MKKEQYTSFIIKLKEQFGDNKIVNNFILDAEELAKYSEMRIALENLLENLIDNEIVISQELVGLAEEAFSDNPSDYDRQLIMEIKQIWKIFNRGGVS